MSRSLGFTLTVILLCSPWLYADGPVDYVRHVKPIFAEHCYKCHGVDKQRSLLRLDHPGLVVEGGESGPAIISGQPDQSLLLRAVTGVDGWRMPPEDGGEPLSDSQIAVLRKWIEQGAAVR